MPDILMRKMKQTQKRQLFLELSGFPQGVRVYVHNSQSPGGDTQNTINHVKQLV